MKDLIYEKQFELQKLIDGENGKNFNKNIDLSGWTFYRDASFISFKLVEISHVQTAVVQYIYITNKNDLVKLLAQVIKFFQGNDVKYIYFLEHAREANYCKKYLSLLGFKIVEEERPGVWKYNFKSTNGYKENEIREYYI